MVTAAMKSEWCLLLGRKFMTNLDSVLKAETLLYRHRSTVKAMVFPVVMYDCESWTVKKAECQRIDAFQTVVLEKTPESPLDSKEIQPVNLKGDQPSIFIEKTDAEAETPVFWSSDANRWITGKDPDAGKDWGQKGNRASEGEMAGWHHQCNGHELGQTPGDGQRQRPGVLQSMRLRRVRHDWVTEQQHLSLYDGGLHILLNSVWTEFSWNNYPLK